MNEKWLYFYNVLVSRLVNAGKSAPSKDWKPQNILVVKWDEIGDMAMAMQVFALLKFKQPQAEIDVLCKPFVKSLIVNDPHISNIFTNENDWIKTYDCVVELRGTWKTLWKSLSFKTMPKFRVDRGMVRFRQRGAQPHELLTNYRVIAPLLGDGDGFQYPTTKALGESNLLVFPKVYTSANDVVMAQDWISNLVGEQRFAILHTGARRALRRWSVDRFVELSRWLHDEKGLQPIWVATKSEIAQIDEAFEKGAVGVRWVADVTEPATSSLSAFYALIERANLYIGNESGPLQLADIADIPLVAIYGPGVPQVFYPRSSNAIILHKVLDCNPCDQLHCVRPNDRCMDHIGLIQVQKAIDSLIG